LNSVRLRMIADVPVGVLLSGGIDSSLIAALAAETSSHPIKTFTVSIPGNKDYDESRHARVIAKHFGTDHLEVAVSPTSVDVLPVFASQFDEPIGDSSIIPTYLLARAVRSHTKAALTGDGGDELFGGYVHYNALLWLSAIRPFVPSSVRAIAG